MSTDKINKPITVARVEFINTLTNLINNSLLPPFVLEAELRNIYNEIRMISQKQYEDDKVAYENQLKQQDLGE